MFAVVPNRLDPVSPLLLPQSHRSKSHHTSVAAYCVAVLVLSRARPVRFPAVAEEQGGDRCTLPRVCGRLDAHTHPHAPGVRRCCCVHWFGCTGHKGSENCAAGRGGLVGCGGRQREGGERASSSVNHLRRGGGERGGTNRRTASQSGAGQAASSHEQHTAHK